MNDSSLIELRGLGKRFVDRLGMVGTIGNLFGAGLMPKVVRAVDGVDLAVARNEVVGLVGESGCGKSTLGRIVAGLLQPSEGEVYFEGKRVDELKAREYKRRSLAIQMIFQDPYASLNPRRRVDRIVGEAPLVHGMVARDGLNDYLDDILGRVGLDAACKSRYPHQFSGGQRQRIGIARALAVQPRFIVCDEAVSALDVSIQAQVLNLFIRLREELGLTYLFISHDLGVVRHISDRIVIMYLGRVVEAAGTDELFESANHPYTRALLDDMPTLHRRRYEYRPISGEIPSPLNPPGGCHFHPRCRYAMARCRTEAPALKEIAPGHFSACHLNST